MISRTPPSPDVLPPTFLHSPLGSHQGLLLPPRLSPLLPRAPSLPWLDSQGLLATWHGPWQDGSVFPGVPRVKGRARGCPCRPSVCPLLESVGGSTSLWGPQGAMQGSSWIPLLEEEKEGATSRCGPSGVPLGSADPVSVEQDDQTQALPQRSGLLSREGPDRSSPSPSATALPPARVSGAADILRPPRSLFPHIMPLVMCPLSFSVPGASCPAPQ